MDEKQQNDRLTENESNSQYPAWEIYNRLLAYSFQYSFALMLSILGFALYAATQPFSAKMLEYIVDAIEDVNSPFRFWIPLVIIFVFLARGVGSVIGIYTLAFVSRHVVHNIRTQLFKRLVYLDYKFHVESVPGKLVSKCTFNVEQISSAATDAIAVLLREGLTVIGLLGFLFYSNWKLTLIFLSVTPLIAIVVTFANKKFRKAGQGIQDSMGDVTQVASEVMSSISDIKLYAGVPHEIERFNKTSENNRIKTMKMALAQAFSVPVIQLIVSVALSILVALALNPDIVGKVTTGEFIAFIAAAMLIVKPIRSLVQINSKIQVGIAAAHSIFEVLDTEEEKDEGNKNISRAKGAINIEDLYFRYEEDLPWVLEGINMKIEPGETIALVGKSGAGKTSLINLLVRFYEQNKGKIMLDGHDIREYRLADLRRQFAFVSQKISLFNDSIRHNIQYGDLSIDSEEGLYQAAKISHADEFIESLPNKYETMIGQDGVQLSGGQRQRLAIARCIYKNAPVLILDEATSALDTESERFFQEALEALQEDRTTIIIAHRLSTVENADKIIVMDQGKIIEMGSHQELISTAGYYAKLIDAQTLSK